MEKRVPSAALPGLLALFFAALAASAHTRRALDYFQPRLHDVLAAFIPWGPFFSLEWGPHLLRGAGAGIFFLSLPGLGRWLRFPWGRGSGEALFNTAAALAAWSTLGLALAALHLSSPGFLKGASIALIAAGLAGLRREDFPSRAEASAFLRSPLGWGIAAFAGLYLLTTVVPDTFYDALVYHLAVPQAYLRAGRLVDLADVHLTRIPGLVQTLFLWALAWSDDRLCKWVCLGIGLLAAAAAGTWTARRRSLRAGLWAALLFLSSPMIGVNLWSCANDLLAGLFFFLAFAAWNGPDGRTRPGLAGACFGAALAAKYTALFGLPYFALELALKFRRDRRPPWREALLFMAGAAALLSPWWLRAAVQTGNPFFPEAAGWLGGDRPENLALLTAWKADAHGGDGLVLRATSLLRESVQGVETGRFGFIGPALLMLLPLVFFVRPSGSTGALHRAAWTSYAFYVCLTGRLRYFIPQLGLLFILAAVCLDEYLSAFSAAGPRIPAAVRRVLGWMKGLAGLAVALNALWLILVFQKFNQGWDVVWGRVSPAAYLRQEHIGTYGHPSQGAFDFLAEQPGPGGRLFIVGEARTYRSPLSSRAGGTFNVPPYALWLREDPSSAAFIARLRREGYSHLLLNAPELRRIAPEAYRSGEYLQGLGAVLDALAPPVYRDRWTVLFRVPPEPPAVR